MTTLPPITPATDAYVDAWLVAHSDSVEVCRWCGELFDRPEPQRRPSCPTCEVILARCDGAYDAAYLDYRAKRYGKRRHVPRGERRQIEVLAHWAGKQASDHVLVAQHPHARWSTPEERKVYPGAFVKIDCPLVWEMVERLKLARPARQLGGVRQVNFCGEALAA